MEFIVPLFHFYSAAVHDPRIGVTHISLFLALLHRWYTAGGTNPFTIDRSLIMQHAKIRSRCTYNTCMNDLHDFGYIVYTRSVNVYFSSTVFLNLDK
jgi:hypothetical protein